MTATRSELQAWLDADDTPDGPDAQTIADFLGVELAPEPVTPVGQRRRSPSGVEVVKTGDGFKDPWRKYQGRDPGPTWFADDKVADWEVITDAPECDREHLPEGYVSVDFRAISSASLAWFVNVPSGRALLQIGDAARAELARRDES